MADFKAQRRPEGKLEVSIYVNGHRVRGEAMNVGERFFIRIVPHLPLAFYLTFVVR